MIPEPLNRALEATGYLVDGDVAAPSVTLLGESYGRPPSDTAPQAWLPSFKPDALWRSDPEIYAWGPSSTDLTVYFKFVEEPAQAPLAKWQQEIWNRGFSPLLWVICPDRIDLYNGFGPPQRTDADQNRLDRFPFADAELARLDNLAGRLAMETGRFWQRSTVSRQTGVGKSLLEDLSRLERDLVAAELPRADAQGLIGRSIFAKYLMDRQIIQPERLRQICGYDDLSAALRDHAAAERFFEWSRDTFNGDLFPQSTKLPRKGHLDRVAGFLDAEDADGQLSLFPYQFDVIPVELISAIYEQFVHSAATDETSDDEKTAEDDDVYYTPPAAVSLVLDEMLHDATGDETVLDLTCGSGVFLVEALRRLVWLKGKGQPTRQDIHHVLYHQIVGADISPAAIRVAAFSLYLAALELDPEPRPPSELKFKPLIGRTLLTGDARTIETTPAGKTTLRLARGLRQFDVIVGNPPWSFRGRGGTATRRAARSNVPMQPRGQSLDFVNRALDFAHDRTRFGMILSAAPFFSRSPSSSAAARHVVTKLGSTTLVNLADLTSWLFPKANMPAVALLARHRQQHPDSMTLVQALWSPTGARSHTIEIAPTNVTTLPVASWHRNAGLFKAAFLGNKRDLLLLDHLWEQLPSFKDRLQRLKVTLNAGLSDAHGSNDARFLQGLPYAKGRLIRRFNVPTELPPFDLDHAERPRKRENYRAPLLVVGEFLRSDDGGYPTAAVSEHDLVFPIAYFGASFDGWPSDIAYLLAGILGSALASWFYLMTGSTFGLWVQRVKLTDVLALPMPDLEAAVDCDKGRRVVSLVRDLHERRSLVRSIDLDEAVFDLYGLHESDRVVVRDGLRQASWQWRRGRLDSVAPANTDDLGRYASGFLRAMDAWFDVSRKRRMRAEIYELPSEAPSRVVRFVIENTPPPSTIQRVPPDGPLDSVLTAIGDRTQVSIAEELVGTRELFVHGTNEVSIIKPAARRNWLPTSGLNDADAVMEQSVLGSRAS